MNTDGNKIITALFERKLIGTLKDMAIYIYIPLQIIEGREFDFNGNKMLFANIPNSDIDKDYYNEDTKRYEFSYLGDPLNTFEKYGYGFSIILGKESKDEIRTIKKQMIETLKSLFDHPIIHLVDNTSDFNKVFINFGTLNYNIDAENYFELNDIIKLNPLEDKRLEVRVVKKSEAKEEQAPIKKELYAKDIYNKVSKTVVCQDDSIREIATSLAINNRIQNSGLKSNMLICGPTGVGKTEIFRTIHEQFDIPITVEDSSEYTAASFKGKDVTEMLLHLLDNANGDILKAERGIVVVDEIDKKVSSNNEHATYTSAVINSLLTMSEGHVYILNVPGQGEIPFDTSNVTFAFLGAFSGIEKYSPQQTSSMGFNGVIEKPKITDMTQIYNEFTLAKYGLLPEFLGRINIITLNALGIEELVHIIKTSDKSQLLLYKKELERIGIDFKYDDKTVEAIAKKAIELQRGARSIKKIVEKAMKIANYEAFSRNNYTELIISEETIEDNKKFILK